MEAYKWTRIWLMLLNKHKYFVLRLRKNNPNILHILDNYMLYSINQISDLGVIPDKELSLCDHVARESFQVCIIAERPFLLIDLS